MKARRVMMLILMVFILTFTEMISVVYADEDIAKVNVISAATDQYAALTKTVTLKVVIKK